MRATGTYLPGHSFLRCPPNSIVDGSHARKNAGLKLQCMVFAFLTVGVLMAFQAKDALAQQQCTAISCDADAQCEVPCGTCWKCNISTNLCEPDSSFCDGFSGGLEGNLCRSAQCVQGGPANPTGCDYSIKPNNTDPQCILCQQPRPTTQPTCGDGSCEPELGENCQSCPVDCLVPGFDEACPRGGAIPPDQQCFGPDLGLAGTFGILSSTYTNTAAGTTINGDLGYTTGPATTPAVNGTTYTPLAPDTTTYPQAGLDQATVLAALNGKACTFTFAPGAVDLATDTTHGPIGVYTSGVYCMGGAVSIGTAGITLSGSGTFIFRMVGALNSVTGSSVTLSNASACNVWWTPTGATTLAANTTFIGNVIDAAGITIGSTVDWTGRALAFGGTVSTDSDTITVPTPPIPPVPTFCGPPPPAITFPGPPFTGSGDAVCEDGDACTQSACNQQTGTCEPQTNITACSGSSSDLCCPAFCVPFDANDPACASNPTLCDADCIPEQYCPFCGNNIVDPGETCDGTATNNCGTAGCNNATCQCNTTPPPPLVGRCVEGSGFNNDSGNAPGDCTGWSGCSLGTEGSASGFMLPMSAVLLGILLVQRRYKRISQVK